MTWINQQTEDVDKNGLFEEINYRINGCPIWAFAYLFGMVVLFEGILLRDIVRGRHLVMTTWPVFLAGLIQFGVAGTYFALLIKTQCGRKWLFTREKPPAGKAISKWSRWIVWSMPIFLIWVLLRVWMS